MKQKSNKHKLFGAAASLLLSVVMLSSSTYAWFTINKEASVENINMKVTTSSNLLISETNTSDSTFVEKLTTSRYALLEPTSTVDGINYYYTLDGAADGHKIHGPDTDNPYAKYNEGTALTKEDTYAFKTNFDSDFNSAYGIASANPTTLDKYLTAYGYVDYTFYLKGVTTAANTQIVMDKCNLLYNGAVVEEKAWRAALLVQETTQGTEPTSAGTLQTIIGLDGAENQTANKAVNSTTTVDTISKAGNNAIVASNIPANSTKYYKVVIRVWIEGEDKTCTTEVFGTKTEEYTMELDFSIKTGATPVNKISSEVN